MNIPTRKACDQHLVDARLMQAFVTADTGFKPRNQDAVIPCLDRDFYTFPDTP